MKAVEPREPELIPMHSAREPAATGHAGPSLIREYLAAVRSAMWWLIAGVAVAGMGALAVSWLMVPQYEAVATLLASQSKVGEQPVPTVDTRSFRAFMENQSLAAEIVHRFQLNVLPEELTPESFLRRSLSVGEIRGSGLLEVRVALSNPQLAASVANAVADRAVQLARTLNQEEAVVARDSIKTQLDSARTRLTDARAAYEAYQREAQVDLLQKEIDVLVDQQGRLKELLVEIAAERARLASAERELASQERVRDVRSALRQGVESPRESGTQPGATDNARGTTDNPGRAGRAPDASPQFREGMLDPYVNPVYETLQTAVTTTRARLASLVRERDELARLLRTDKGQLSALSTLYSRRARLDELKMQQELAEKLYMDVATRYEQARLQVTGRSVQLQVVDRALPPERRASPRVGLNVFAAMVLALSLGLGLVIAARAIRYL
jgi:uncharacterized protein involved in exopolysaccharide biosynthesis